MEMSAIATLSPYIRVAMDHWLNPGTVLDERMLWDYELLYVKQGTLEVDLAGQGTLRASDGDVLLLKPRQAHVIRVPEPGPVRQPHIHFDLYELPDSGEVPVSFKHEGDMTPEEIRWFRDDLLSGPELRLGSLIRLQSVHPFEELLFRIIREFEMGLPYYRIRVKSLLLELLVCLLRDAQSPPLAGSGGVDVRLEDVQLYLSENAGRELALDELAAQFHMNKHDLIRRFKSAYGITPIRFHHQLRIERARSLLKHSRLSVQDISDTLGYPSIHAFSRAFKNKEGRSPTAYRDAASAH